MKIKTKKFSNFLKKIQMEDSQKIDDCLFDFSEDGVKVNANSMPQQSNVVGLLKPVAFETYEAIGNVGVNNLSTFIRVIERFGDTIELKKQGNLITIKSGNKKVDLELINENAITSTNSKDLKLEHTDEFTISSNKLLEVFKDVKMNKDCILVLKTYENKVSFENTGKYKFTNEVEAEGTKGGVTVSFGQPFLDALSRLEGDIKIKVRDDFPCLVFEETEESLIKIIVGPRVGDD